jgi:uncharacterized protein YdaU (DUF1376 family)
MDRPILPYFPFYVDDWETSPIVESMTFAEQGLYLRCLISIWRYGWLPSDVHRIAIRVGSDGRTVSNLWRKVNQCFVPNGTPGQLTNKRLEMERTKALVQSQRNSIAGKRSAAVRASVATSVERTLQRSFNHTDTDTDTEENSISSKTTDLPGADLDMWAEGIYARWLKRGDRILALQALCELTIPRPEFEAMYTKWVVYHERNNWKFAPKLANFLVDETYKYEPATDPEKPGRTENLDYEEL